MAFTRTMDRKLRKQRERDRQQRRSADEGPGVVGDPDAPGGPGRVEPSTPRQGSPAPLPHEAPADGKA